MTNNIYTHPNQIPGYAPGDYYALVGWANIITE